MDKISLDLAAKDEDFANPQGADPHMTSADTEEAAPPSVDEGREEPVLSTPPDAPRGGDIPMTQKVARRIREERQKAREELITEIFGSRSELEAFNQSKAEKAQREAEATQTDEAELAAYREMEDIYTRIGLAADPATGHLFRQWQDDIDSLAQANEISLDTAFILTMAQRLPDILSSERARIEQETIAKIISSSGGPGPLSSPAEEPPGFSGLSEGEFDALLAKVKGGEIK